MTRVFLYGYYGYNNLGDELLKAISTDLIREVIPGASISVRKAGICHCRSLPIGLLKAIQFRASILCAALINVLRACRSDVLIFGGGGVFPPGATFLTRLEQQLSVRLASIRGSRIAGIGLEVPSEREQVAHAHGSYVKGVLSHIEFLWTRDDESAEACQDSNFSGQLVKGGDLAWLIAGKYLKRERDPAKQTEPFKIGLCVPHQLVQHESAMHRLVFGLSSFVDQQVENAKSLVVLSAQECRFPGLVISDADSGQKFCDEAGLPVDRHLPLSASTQSSAMQTIRLLEQFDLVISARFHVAVLALIAGVPVGVLPINQKLKSLSAPLDLWEGGSWEPRDNPEDIRILRGDETLCLREIAASESAVEEFLEWLSRTAP